MTETPPLDVGKISRVLETLLFRDSRPVMLRSMVSWQLNRVPAHVAAAPDGLLPAFLTASDALLREATGQGIETLISSEPHSLLGFRVDEVRHNRFADVLLGVMEAIDQISRNGRLMADDLKLVVDLSRARLQEALVPDAVEAARLVPEPAIRLGPSP
jgi:hypothetical protein